MSARHGPGMSRRGFLSASAAGLGAASAAGLTAACSGPGAATAGPAADRPALGSREFTGAVLDAFETRRLVGLGEAHGLQNHHDALEALLSDPRLPQVVDDIVVEFGNALYQPVMDRFTAASRSTTPTCARPGGTPRTIAGPDQPVYEQFFRTVRAANWTLPPDRRIRVLLGDPPLDWSKMTGYDELRPILAQRDTHAAMVVETQVLGNGRRRCSATAPNTCSTPPRRHRPHSPAAHGRADVHDRGHRHVPGRRSRPAGRSLAAYARNTVIPTAGTWLGCSTPGCSWQLRASPADQGGGPNHPPSAACRFGHS